MTKISRATIELLTALVLPLVSTSGCGDDSAGDSAGDLGSTGSGATSSSAGSGGSSSSGTTGNDVGSSSDTGSVDTSTGGDSSASDSTGATPSPIDCPSTCGEVLAVFCPDETITDACMMNCAEEAAAANAIGAPCADAYTVWFACVLTQFETSAAETCAMAVAWYETHELPPEDALCYAELSAFAAACELG